MWSLSSSIVAAAKTFGQVLKCGTPTSVHVRRLRRRGVVVGLL